jgi:hypothetical protein
LNASPTLRPPRIQIELRVRRGVPGALDQRCVGTRAEQAGERFADRPGLVGLVVAANPQTPTRHRHR